MACWSKSSQIQCDLHFVGEKRRHTFSKIKREMLSQIKDYQMWYLYRKKKWQIFKPILRALSAQ